jgi:hypothetical protein
MAIAPSSSTQVPPTGARLQHVAHRVVTTHPQRSSMPLLQAGSVEHLAGIQWLAPQRWR